MQTIAELPEFIRTAEKLLTHAERLDIVRYLAEHPKAGDLMEGTGGVRKLRWGRSGQGKSDKSNLTKAERNELAGLVALLVLIWKEKKA